MKGMMGNASLESENHGVSASAALILTIFLKTSSNSMKV